MPDANPRLARILDFTASDIEYGQVEYLVTERQPEDQVLEYKVALYPDRRHEKKDPSELAKDVAAFANASGGMILIGVAEDDHAASKICDVALGDRIRRQMTHEISSKVAPIPAFSIQAIPNQNSVELGVWAIHIPPSSERPHSVQLREASYLCWPIREGTTTRFMREPEIAGTYRRRFDGESALADRVLVDFNNGIMKRSPHLAAWLAISMTPTRPAPATQASSALISATRSWFSLIAATLPDPYLFGNNPYVGVGRGRVVVSSSSVLNRSDDWVLELHTDGTGFGMIKLPVPQIAPDEDAESGIGARVSDIEILALNIVVVLSSWLDHRAAAGEVVARAALVTPAARADTISESMARLRLAQPSVFNGVAFGNRWVGGGVAIRHPSPTMLTLPSDLGNSRADLIAAARWLAIELISEFGVEETFVLDVDGAIKGGSQDSRHLEEWAGK